MTKAQWCALAGLVVLAVELAACKGPAGPLPPVPAGSGGVLVRAGETPPIKDSQAVIDRVVAVVNGDVIMMSELQEAIVLSRRDGRDPPDAGPDLERTMLNRLVDHRLQVQEAKRDKVEVSEDDLRSALDDIVKRNGGDREKFETQLMAQGVTWEALRREIRDQLLAQRVRSRRVVRRSTVTEPEVDQYLAQNREKFEAGLKYHAYHLAVTVEVTGSPAAWEQAKQEIEAIATALAGGADFAEMAKTRGKDPAGGDLGWLARGELDPAFEKPLLALQKGQVTAPIRSGSAYHLLKLDDREELTADKLADARQQVRDLLLQKKAQERFDEWLETLRRRALIAIRL
jgi:peptidyl-prolyl cis-trans isomerase SurA